MWVTEEEARQKWCPLAREPYYGQRGEADIAVAVNRDTYGAMVGHCVGSYCMFWLWKDDNTGPVSGWLGCCGAGRFA